MILRKRERETDRQTETETETARVTDGGRDRKTEDRDRQMDG